jgi:hypothetical protein
VPALRVSASGKRAKWCGVAACDSWDCPRCARGKADKWSHRIGACIAEAADQGWRAYFLTLTQSHTSGDTLASLVRGAREGWRRVRRVAASHHDVKGLVGAIEVTLGARGWHVHYHAILWTDDPTTEAERAMAERYGASVARPALGFVPAWFAHGETSRADYARQTAQIAELKAAPKTTASEAYRVKEEIYRIQEDRRWTLARALRLWHCEAPLWTLRYALVQAWAGGVARTGRPRPDWRRQDLRPCKHEHTGAALVAYMIKTGYELAGQPYKRGRGDAHTPGSILHSAAAGCHEGRRAWREYREALAGVHRIQGVASMEKRLCIGEPPPVQSIHIRTVDHVAYFNARRISYDRLLVRLAELPPLIYIGGAGGLRGGPAEAARVIDDAGQYATCADWRQSAAEVLGVVNLLRAGGSWRDARGSGAEPVALALQSMYCLWGIDGHTNDNRCPDGRHENRRLAERLGREIAGADRGSGRRLDTLPPGRVSVSRGRRQPDRGGASAMGESLRAERKPDRPNTATDLAG